MVSVKNLDETDVASITMAHVGVSRAKNLSCNLTIDFVASVLQAFRLVLDSFFYLKAFLKFFFLKLGFLLTSNDKHNVYTLYD